MRTAQVAGRAVLLKSVLVIGILFGNVANAAPTTASANLTITVKAAVVVHSCAPTGAIVNLSPGANIQNAVNAASPGATLLFGAGTYTISSRLVLASGVSLVGLPGAVLQKATGNDSVLYLVGVSNITICGFSFIGEETHTGPGGSILLASLVDSQFGFVFVVGGNNNHVVLNTSTNNFSMVQAFNTDGLYVQGNTSNGDWEPINFTYNDNATHSNVFITDNHLSYWSRNGIEGGDFSPNGSLTNVNPAINWHIDRNVLINDDRDQYTPNGGGLMMSILSYGGSSGNTVWGNTCTVMPNANPSRGEWCLELGEHFTVSQNVTNVYRPIQISLGSGSAILNNTFAGFTSAAPLAPFGEDGGYNGTEWIGQNLWNGSSVVGWPGGPTVYGAAPPLFSPSAPFP